HWCAVTPVPSRRSSDLSIVLGVLDFASCLADAFERRMQCLQSLYDPYPLFSLGARSPHFFGFDAFLTYDHPLGKNADHKRFEALVVKIVVPRFLLPYGCYSFVV